MFKGQEHVQLALEICRNASGEVRKLADVEQGWKTGVARRIECVHKVLDGVMDKFLLTTKLCLPFAFRCEKEARRLAETLHGLQTRPDENSRQQFIGALDALEGAAKVLNDRSSVQGMTIT